MKKLILLVVLACVATATAIVIGKKRKMELEVTEVAFHVTDPTNPAFQQLQKILEFMEKTGFTEDSRAEYTELVILFPKIQTLFNKYLNRQVLSKHKVDFIAISHKTYSNVDDTPEHKAHLEMCAREATALLASKSYDSVCFEGVTNDAKAKDAEIQRLWEDIKGIPTRSFGGELGNLALLQAKFQVTLKTSQPALKQTGLFEKFLDMEDALSQVRSYIALAYVIARLEQNPRENIAICYGARHAEDLEKIAVWSGLRYSVADMGESYKDFKQIKATFSRDKWF